MRKSPIRRKFVLLPLIFGFITAYPAACRWFSFFQKPFIEKVVLLVSLWIFFSTIFWFVSNRFQFQKTFPSSHTKYLIGSIAALVGSLVILSLFHWLPPGFPSTYQINIIPQGNVQLVGAHAGDEQFALDHFSGSDGWQWDENHWSHTGGSQNPINFTGTASAPLELTFAAGKDAGSVEIKSASRTTRISLNAHLTDTFFTSPDFGSPAIIMVFWISLLALSEWLLLAGFLFFIFSHWAGGSFALIFPFVFLLPYITTFAGHNVTLGNDFGPFYYVYKTYLLDFLSHGRFPLWSPSEAAGFPFFSNPLAQTVYPPNLVLVLIYWINQGYTRLDHQIFTVMAVSWFSLGLYLWLRSLRVEKRFALFAALTMALSFKMTELLRFPNAAHEAAWYPWILLSLTRVFSAKNIKSALRWGAALSTSLICLFTAGYPYYVYYLPFLAGPYLLFMFIPRLRKVYFGIPIPNWVRFFSIAAVSTLTALLICAPYLFQMSRTITQTAGRSGDDFAHATMYPFDFQDTIESLVYPPAARPEGWFYFGALGIIVIALYLVHRQKEVTDTNDPILRERRSWVVKAALLAWLVFISYISYGEQSYLFLLFYKILPEFSALRGWGRLSITLLPGLALLLAFALADFESRLTETPNPKRRIHPSEWIPLVFFALAGFSYQIFALSRAVTDEYWDIYFIPRVAYLTQTIASTWGHNLQPDPDALSYGFSFAFILFGLAALLIVLLALRRTHFKHQSFAQKSFYLLIGLFSAVNLWFGGPWLWNNGFSPKEDRQTGNYQRMLSTSFSTPRKNENSTLTLSPSFSVGSPPKWHYARYQDFYFSSADNPNARDQLMGIIDGQRFFFSSDIQSKNIPEFLKDADQYAIEPVVHEYTGDSLVVEVTVSQTGYFSFIDNWDEDWRVSVDGKPEKLDKLFGVFKSVRLTPGRHEISMAFCPQFFTWANNACNNFK